MASLRRLGVPTTQWTPGQDLTQPDSQQTGADNSNDGTTLGESGGQNVGLGADKTTKGQSSETPRDRIMTPGAGGPITSTPRQPDTPTPAAGAGGVVPQPQGVIPFTPMGNPMTGLFGSAGGLQGGGLGMPLDPTTNAANNPITGLLQLLTQNLGRQ